MKENEQDSKAHWRRQALRAMQELQALAEEISGAEEILFRLSAEYEAQFALMKLYFRLADDEPPLVVLLAEAMLLQRAEHCSACF